MPQKKETKQFLVAINLVTVISESYFSRLKFVVKKIFRKVLHECLLV